jgi:hypothetical protein
VLVGTCFWSILDRVLDRVSRPPKIRVSIQPYKNSYPDTLPIQNKNPYLQLFRFFRKSMKPEKSDFSGPRIPSPEQFWPAFISPKQPLLIPQAPAHPSSILPSIIHTAIHHPYCHHPSQTSIWDLQIIIRIRKTVYLRNCLILHMIFRIRKTGYLRNV